MLVGWDTETERVTKRVKAPRMVISAFADSQEAWLAAPQNAAITIKSYLESDIQIATFNGAYDFGVLLQQAPELTPLVWEKYASNGVIDVMTDAKLIDIAVGKMHHTGYGYNLADQTKRWLGRDYLNKKDLRVNYGPLLNVSPHEWPAAFQQYPKDDATNTRDLALNMPDPGPDRYNQARHNWWLHLVSAHGIITDVPRVLAKKKDIEDELVDLRRDLEAAKLIRLEGKNNPRWVKTTARAKELILETTPANKLRYTPTGLVSTDSEACEDSGDERLKKYAHYASLLDRYDDIPKLLEGELHARFDSLKDTGRTGSGGRERKDDDSTIAVNMQNWPRDGGWRECFIPRPGYAFVLADYAQLEAYCFAQICISLFGWSNLATLLNAGKDIHVALASLMMGISYEEGKTRFDAGDKELKKVRQTAKPANFGKLGGMGENHFIAYSKSEYGVIFTHEQAQKIDKAWRGMVPEFRLFSALSGKLTRNGRASFTHYKSNRVRGGNTFTEWMNGQFQGLGGDCAKYAGWLVSREMYDITRRSVLYGSRIVNFEHDAILGEVPLHLAKDCALRIGELMGVAGKEWLPDVPAHASPSISMCWSKNAPDVDLNKPETWTPWHC